MHRIEGSPLPIVQSFRDPSQASRPARRSLASLVLLRPRQNNRIPFRRRIPAVVRHGAALTAAAAGSMCRAPPAASAAMGRLLAGGNADVTFGAVPAPVPAMSSPSDRGHRPRCHPVSGVRDRRHGALERHRPPEVRRARDAVKHALEPPLEAPFARVPVGVAAGARSIAIFDAAVSSAVSVNGAGERKPTCAAMARGVERGGFWGWRGRRHHRRR